MEIRGRGGRKGKGMRRSGFKRLEPVWIGAESGAPELFASQFFPYSCVPSAEQVLHQECFTHSVRSRHGPSLTRNSSFATADRAATTLLRPRWMEGATHAKKHHSMALMLGLTLIFSSSSLCLDTFASVLECGTRGPTKGSSSTITTLCSVFRGMKLLVRRARHLDCICTFAQLAPRPARRADQDFGERHVHHQCSLAVKSRYWKTKKESVGMRTASLLAYHDIQTKRR